MTRAVRLFSACLLQLLLITSLAAAQGADQRSVRGQQVDRTDARHAVEIAERILDHNARALYGL